MPYSCQEGRNADGEETHGGTCNTHGRCAASAVAARSGGRLGPRATDGRLGIQCRGGYGRVWAAFGLDFERLTVGVKVSGVENVGEVDDIARADVEVGDEVYAALEIILDGDKRGRSCEERDVRICDYNGVLRDALVGAIP